ncbi:phosphate-binding protein pstS 2 [Mycobacterium kansasii]|uniref:Phosphate-binding protein pstS 2 n=1 Tax=Mycobacterium kansasii TaxID=1768 RepID=A0A1V3XQX0_MYCKA|nr:phosphate-binding protein pstS 2 [Mycobacterium kansasii]
MEEFVNNRTDLAGSDVPLDPSTGQPDRAAARCGSPAWDLPTVFGPIAVTYNVNGVSKLNLDGPTTAKIFNGTITRWDDPRSRPSTPTPTCPDAHPRDLPQRQIGDHGQLPEVPRRRVRRRLGKGVGETFHGGVGDGAAGNNGTSALLETTDGSITYNEWSFAVGKQLHMAGIITSAGPDPVLITTDSVGKTIAGHASRGKATTWCWIRRRSTSRHSPALTRSCWRPMRSCAPSTRTRRRVRR